MPKQVLQAHRWKLGLSIFWLIFTLSMVTWWWIFSLQQLDHFGQELTPEKYHSLKQMLLWEGSILLLFIFAGGTSLLILTNRERQRNLSLRLFFSTFTHDLKTSLNRLRLRAEVLAPLSQGPAMQALMEEVTRLDLQLENSLWIARGENQALLMEEFSIDEVLSGLRLDWPDLELVLSASALIRADRQAMQSIIRNIFQNAWAHGQATRIDINVERGSQKGRVKLIFQDNGRGMKGDIEELGQSFVGSQGSQGNGIGLYLTTSLLNRMQGKIEFKNTESGFCVFIEIPGEIKGVS